MTSSIWVLFWSMTVLAKGDPEWTLLWFVSGAIALAVDFLLWMPQPKRRRRR